jgi:hypothetical protein
LVEGVLGLRLLLQPASAGTFRPLAFIIISLYAVALVRAWTLLGDPQYGWSGWLNPFQDLVATEETIESSETSSHRRPGGRFLACRELSGLSQRIECAER